MASSLFFHPDSLPLHLLQALFISLGLQVASSEYSGHHLPYSKFAHTSSRQQIPSRLGMLILYSPSFLLSSAGLLLFTPASFYNLRFLLLAAALTIHFFKRILEVLLVHVYSGSMEKRWSMGASMSYGMYTAAILYAQKAAHLQQQPPALDCMPLGIGLFAVGSVGNLHHHRLLASLRKREGEGGGASHRKKYVIPEGGLFPWVVCPHYLFEVGTFLGIALIAQTLTAMAMVVSMACILALRSRATRAWCIERIDGFPAGRRALVPFVF